MVLGDPSERIAACRLRTTTLTQLTIYSMFLVVDFNMKNYEKNIFIN